MFFFIILNFSYSIITIDIKKLLIGEWNVNLINPIDSNNTKKNFF